MIRDLTTTSGRCEAMLIDLGVARQFIPEMIRFYTFTPGTVGFCPPELELARLEMQKQLLLNPQAEFKLHIEQSESIDVYSLAATLYFMITGRQPRDSPLVIPDYIEPAICDAITSGMARIPELRPKTIAEWLVKLPLTFREVWRIEGKVLEFDPNNPNQGTYSLHDRRVNSAKAKSVTEIDLGKGVMLELVKVPAGKFMMGSDEYDSEKPIHQVQLNEFLIGKYAVTNAQWQSVMKPKGSANCNKKFQGNLQPVVGVSWHEARTFCEKLSQQTGREVRLPTEAEWEYACRAGTTTPFPFGKTVTTEQVNYDGNYPYGDASKGKYCEVTVNVDSFQPNAWGIYQMHGNVWEWCLDEWHDSYADKPENLKMQGNQAWGELNMDDNDNHSRQLRDGSWDDNARSCRSALRNGSFARGQYDYVGFRVLLVSSS